MKKIKNNVKGITLVSLIITVIVLLILASIGTYSGIEVIKSSKFTKFTTEMKIMQTHVNELYDKYKNGDNEILILGKELNTVQEQTNKVFTLETSGITDKTGYRYFDQETIKCLNIEGIEEEFFLNIEKRSVVSYEGFKYEGTTYYTLEQIPSGLYNVEYENKNTGTPTFNVNVEKISEGKWRISILDIIYDGYIEKWQVKYKLSNQENWNTSEDLNFVLEQEGIYNIKLSNGASESKEVSKIVSSTYMKEGLVLWLDGIENTRKGHNENQLTDWQDLSGNDYDFTAVGGTAVIPESNCVPFNGDCVYGNTDTDLQELLQGLKERTIEIVCSISDNNTTAKTIFLGGNLDSSATGVGLWYRPNSKGLCVYTGSSYAHTISDITNPHTYTAVFNTTSINTTEIYQDNVITSTTSGGDMNNVTYTTIGGRYYSENFIYYRFYGKIYSIRVYDRQLNQEEIAHNISIDKDRFNIEETE